MIGPLKNLFGGNKENYFLELDDAATPTTPPAPAPAVAEAPPAAPEQPAPQPAPQAAQPVEKKPARKKRVAKKQVAQAAKPAAAPVAAAPAPQAPAKPVVLFAPSNLMPQPDGKRRTAGPSLDGFKDMAKTMGRR